jgi:hypothetical protein
MEYLGTNPVPRTPGRRWGIALGLALAGFSCLGAAASSRGQWRSADLQGPFDLAGERTSEVQYFRMETQVVHMGFDGRRTGVDTYTLKLKCVPAALAGKAGDEYTCREFLIRHNDEPSVAVPALAGWTYVFRPTSSGLDEAGQVFGVPHAKFEGLTDSRGRKLLPVSAYLVYNSFIDFHSFNDLLSRPVPDGRGIQDLKSLGQKIIHSAAFTEPPVNLGSAIKAGSVFRNGEMTMELKGLGLVDGAPCAIVGYDSGESTLRMITPLGGDKDVVTEGGSEYAGDMFVDLASRWVRKLTLNEFVVTETTVPGPGPKIRAYTVRHVLSRLIGREEYEKD